MVEVDTTTPSVSAPVIFIVVMGFQLLSNCLETLQKKGIKNVREAELRAEIKQMLKEANSLSQPSTFAQASKLRRLAAAKEKELANCQEQHSKEMKLSYDLYLKFLFATKVLTFFVMICWFWRSPVTTVSEQLVQPLGRFLSWGSGSSLNGNIMVGIIPWLVLSTRVSKCVCRLINM